MTAALDALEIDLRIVAKGKKKLSLYPVMEMHIQVKFALSAKSTYSVRVTSIVN